MNRSGYSCSKTTTTPPQRWATPAALRLWNCWPDCLSMRKDAQRFVRNCHTCRRTKTTRHALTAS